MVLIHYLLTFKSVKTVTFDKQTFGDRFIYWTS